MLEATIWVLLWVGSSYGGFVTKVDEFQTKDACVQFARDIQSRHGKDGVYIEGNPICVQRKSSQSGHTQKDQQRAIAR
jgi:hypothetical protein